MQIQGEHAHFTKKIINYQIHCSESTQGVLAVCNVSNGEHIKICT